VIDISPYISNLLFDHDCVIVPGFGGFVANYKPAEIIHAEHTIYPPSKAISFNKYLRNNDGLLVNAVRSNRNISFDEATQLIALWVNSSNSLLKHNESLHLAKIGVLQNDIEGNTQFIPDFSINYLKSSFGLKPVYAQPVMRGKEVELTFDHDYKTVQQKPAASFKRVWKIAAAVLLLVGAFAMMELMWLGIEIPSMRIDEASVMSIFPPFMQQVEPDIKPLPIEAESTPVTPIQGDTTKDETALNEAIVKQEAVEETTPQIIAPKISATENAGGYFVIIGAFKEQQNAENAMALLGNKFSDKDVFIEPAGQLTKVGFYAGSRFADAKIALDSAREICPDSWLLKKN
jgi:hypothetical protein